LSPVDCERRRKSFQTSAAAEAATAAAGSGDDVNNEPVASRKDEMRRLRVCRQMQRKRRL
jgi:hypothetical protein